MATVLDFNVKETDNAKEFRFSETTGAYDSSDNLTGWGSPNEATTAATARTLVVKTPGGSSTTLTLTSTFPTTNSGTELTIDMGDLGGDSDDELADGLWTFTYNVTTASTTYTTEQTIFASGQARCCVFGMLADVELSACSCDSVDKARALEAYTFYMSAVANAATGDSSKFTDLLALVDKYCDNTLCD